MSFSSLGLTKLLTDSLLKNQYTAPFPIQKQVIPLVLNRKDVLAIAPTGSGKTASFALPMLHILQNPKQTKGREIRGLVLVPTRELAVQVAEVFMEFAKDLPFVPVTKAVYGGVSINPQMMALKQIDVLVATPGRFIDLVSNNAIGLEALEILVLDEADKMLNLGFKDEMDEIFKLLPSKRQNLLFTATMGEELTALKDRVLISPIQIKVEEEVDNIEHIEQVAYKVDNDKKGPVLRGLIVSQNMKQVLVFVSSTRKADNVVAKLNANKIDALAIHSQKSQSARLDALTKFKNGSLRVLVATDLMARGIDIISLPFVINYELPRSPLDYVHRIGRTGRAGENGTAISLIATEDEHHFKVIQKKMGKKVELKSLPDLK